MIAPAMLADTGFVPSTVGADSFDFSNAVSWRRVSVLLLLDGADGKNDRSLNLPDLPRHDALNDSINVALMYLSLKARDNR